MTEIAEPQTDGHVETDVARGLLPPAPSSAKPVTFADVVRAHWDWYAAGQTSVELRAVYEDRLAEFEQRAGVLEHVYWSIREPSAVGLTSLRWKRRRRSEEDIPRFHRATDWATCDEPEVSNALDECETLAVKAEEILRGPSEKIALRRIYAVAAHLLGCIDRSTKAPCSPQEEAARRQVVTTVVERQREELRKIELFYARAGGSQARTVYFWGMARGFALVFPVLAAAVALIWQVWGLDGTAVGWHNLQLLVVSVMAGTLGALLSVLARMASPTGKFTLDHELGRTHMRHLGLYRPFVGAIFGLAAFLLLASDLFQSQSVDANAATYGTVAFMSGFFERFMKVTPTGGLVEAEPEKEKAPDQV